MQTTTDLAGEGRQSAGKAATPNDGEDVGPTRAPDEGSRSPQPAPGRIRAFAKSVLKTSATLAISALAVMAAMVIWSYYVTAPWTRDGRIRVQVASVAPQISGQITEIRIIDNQFVHKGDVLYVIDPFDFQVAFDSAKTEERMKAADLQVKRTQAERRQTLSNLATTAEEQQQYAGSATQAHAAFAAAQIQVSQAEINLKRTEVRSPVNGFVTNLLLRVGDYARSGVTVVSVIDADSYWIDGYFEETKLARVCVGDVAEARLMGFASPILGRVQSITRGISVSDAAPSTQGLPGVNPVYTWVRLAQRVPVRIAITDVPAGVPLVSGMTATVSVRNATEDEDHSFRTTFGRAWQAITAVLTPPEPTPGCIPTVGGEGGATTTLVTPQPDPFRSPGQINPGLTPGMAASPKPR